jgi:hypothetical protein
MNIHVPIAEKLDILREADSLRKWGSLDDRRVCVLCGKVITGRMIDVWQDSRGGYNLSCPTPGCEATARDWFYHTPNYVRAVLVKDRKHNPFRLRLPLP